MNRSDFEAQIVARAWKDEAFRAALKANPRKVLSEELAKIKPGAALPDDMEVVLVEETPKKICLVIPPDPRALLNADLTDEQLAVVAGGASSPPPTSVNVTVNVTTINPNMATVIDEGIVVVSPTAYTYAVQTGPGLIVAVA